MLQQAPARRVAMAAPEIDDWPTGEHQHERKTTGFIGAVCVTHLAFLRGGEFQELLLLFG